MTRPTTTTDLPAGIWTLDLAASSAGFTAHQLGRVIPGSIPLTTATVELGPDRDIRGAHIELDLSAIETGIAKRNIDLAKPRLLNTGQFPTLSVDIAPAPFDGEGWRSTATLGLRGVAFDIEVAIRLEAVGPDGSVRVSATSAFDRKPIGMKAPRIAIGRNVEVSVRATFEHAVSHGL
jgi:polyisoprenoid-binding protein YceI